MYSRKTAIYTLKCSVLETISGFLQASVISLEFAVLRGAQRRENKAGEAKGSFIHNLKHASGLKRLTNLGEECFSTKQRY